MANPVTGVRNGATVLTAIINMLAVPITVLAAPVSYSVDPKHTYASFEIDHLGLSTTRGTFDRTSGRITLDPEAATGHIEIVIDSASIDTGLAKRDEHLRAAEFFDVENYPTITFIASTLRFDGKRLTGADGDLTMLGKTLPVSLEITRFSCGSTRFTANLPVAPTQSLPSGAPTGE